MSAYQQLTQRFRRIAMLGTVEDVLNWDRSTMLPTKSGQVRGEQLAMLRVLTHETLTAAGVSDLLDEAHAQRTQLDAWQQANLRAMHRQHIHAAAVPPDLIAAISRACNDCEQLWRQARKDSDFAMVAPSLREVLSLTRRSGEARAAALQVSVYDALLDKFEPGLTSVAIDRLFSPLAAALPTLLGEVVAQQATQPAALPLPGPFPIHAQRALGKKLMRIIGFDFERGRLDVSLHPFCGGYPGDIRITTRYDEADFTSALMGVLHETGHAMYEMGLPAKWHYQPVGTARGMAVHESQSLLVEMQVCRSRPFLEFAAPLIRAAFDNANGGSESGAIPPPGSPWRVDNLHRIYHQISPGFIRVDADEVSYPAHIMLRYDLEKHMMADNLSIDELPGAWNDGMQRLLGITPPSDRLGCLQDIHWYDGDFGYFPCYTLGAILAAQLFQAADAADSQVSEGIGVGNFTPLMRWLGQHVHGQGARYHVDELAQRASGRPLDVDGYLKHLRQRYLGGVEGASS